MIKAKSTSVEILMLLLSYKSKHETNYLPMSYATALQFLLLRWISMTKSSLGAKVYFRLQLSGHTPCCLWLLSTWLHVELTKIQTTRYTCEGFFSTESFEVIRPILNLDLLRWEDPILNLGRTFWGQPM